MNITNLQRPIQRSKMTLKKKAKRKRQAVILLKFRKMMKTASFRKSHLSKLNAKGLKTLTKVIMKFKSLLIPSIMITRLLTIVTMLKNLMMKTRLTKKNVHVNSIKIWI